MAFIESRFPAHIALQSSGGPRWRTTVVRVDSGHEVRNQHWSQELGEWDIGSYLRDTTALQDILAFFQVIGGMTHGFRWKDFHDFQVFNQPLGTGTGSLATFQLTKTYTFGASTYTKTILKPVQGTVTITVAGTPRTEGTQYTIDYTTGIVTFPAGNIPTSGQAVVSPYYEFDKKVRCGVDDLRVTYADLQQGTINLPILELR